MPLFASGHKLISPLLNLGQADYQLIDNQSLLLAFNRLLKFKIGLDQFFEGIRMRLIQIFYNLEKIIESQVFSKTIIDE